jgi:hypothetical protein
LYKCVIDNMVEVDLEPLLDCPLDCSGVGLILDDVNITDVNITDFNGTRSLLN